MNRSVLLLCLAAVPAGLFAQAGAPPAVLQITREFIKEGKGSAHRKVEQEYVSAFRKNNFPFYYVGLSSVSGPNEVWFLDAFPSFAAFEQSDRLESQAPLRDDIEAIEARDGELRSGSREMTAIYRADLSYIPINGLSIGKTRYMAISTYRVRPGHEEEFMAGETLLNNAYKSAMAESSVLVYQITAGVPDGTYLLLFPMASLKEMDDAPAREQALMNAMGSDGFRKLMKSVGDVFVSTESNIFSVSPDISYVPKEIEDEDPGFWRQAPSAAPSKPKRKAATSTK